MIKIIIIFLLIIFFHTKISSQNKLSNWKFQMNIGIEKHDKRLFNFPDREMLLENQPEKWGTFTQGFSFIRRILNKKYFSLFSGLGITTEVATFMRPFNHLYFKQDFHKFLLFQNRYYKSGIFIPTNAKIKILSNINFNLEFYPVVNMQRSIYNSNSVGDNNFPYKSSEFKFTKFLTNIGVNYLYKNLFIGLYYRIYNYQEIDKIIFYNVVNNRRENQKWESYNPMHLKILMGYAW